MSHDDLDAFVRSYADALHRGVLTDLAKHYHRPFNAVFVAGDGVAVGDYDAFFDELWRNAPFVAGDMRFELTHVEAHGPWARMRGRVHATHHGDIDCHYVLARTSEGWRIASKVIVHL